MIDRPDSSAAVAESVLTLVLPDGATRTVSAGTLPAEVVRSIGERLLMAAVAVSVNGEIQDLMTPLRRSGAFRVLTERDAGALAVLRHSAAHVLATAVRRLRPDAKIGFGPAIDEGFYYDFEVATPFTPDDLEKFETEMRKVVAEQYPFVREEVGMTEARKRFVDDPLKLERLDDFTDPAEIISTYTDGPFVDLCRGPHVPDTARLKHFKLLHTAGAYWRGDEKRQMLQRIYGTAFFKKEELEQYLFRIEEAKKRDHRKLGRELDLFQFHSVSPGAAFWTPRGTTLYNTLVDFVRDRQKAAFKEVKTPLLYDKALWEQSGHWGKYKDNMFLVLDNETGEHDMSLKPMNCPSHYVYYASSKHSYRELPLRLTTFDVLHRNELTGALSGLTRVRQFQQDDCHVFLREDQIAEEVRFLVDFILGHYRTFGLAARPNFATRPEQRIGDDAMWDRAEDGLRRALEATGLPYDLKPGDGAFYGPKIDFDVTDSLGRAWQLGTIQLDYANPENFDLTYTGADNAEHRPVIIHRAVSGSFERFIAILIEHFAGAFPTWLAPEQVRVLPISAEQAPVASAIVERMQAAGIRAELDARSETLKYRVAEGARMKVPYMCVVGRREAEADQVAVNTRGAGEGQKPAPVAVEEFIARVQAEVAERNLTLGVGGAG